MADACANGTEACAACGKAGCNLKVCNACKKAKYCSRDCQLSHWRGGHKDACKRIVAEQAMDAKLSKLPEATDEELFAPHPPRDECPICFLPQPMNDQGTQYMACCGKEICHGCVMGHINANGKGSLCPFCRCPNPNGGGCGFLKKLQKRLQVSNDATGFTKLGSQFKVGSESIPQNMDKAMTLYFRGAELGSAEAHFHLGCAYLHGKGLEEDLVKAIHHWEIGALGGNVDARFSLAFLENKGRRAGRAVKHMCLWTQIVDMMAGMNSDASHMQQVEALLKDAKERNVTNSDGSPLEDRDINRLLLSLRYNGFDSGLYMHFAMFNHSEDSNCIKFRPDGEKSTSGYYSEARTTRHVRKGEGLTLFYIENPREVSHATRRKVLWDQHRFEIGDEDAYKQFLDATLDKTGHLLNDNVRGDRIYESELVNGKFPASSKEGSVGGDDSEESDLPATSNIENSLDDLEAMLVELKAIFSVQTEGTIDDSAFGRAAALELAVNELITASETALGNNRHILLSRCRQLHLDGVEFLLAHCSSKLTERQSVELMARFLPSCQQLLESQQRRLGNDHPDVARTCGDLSQGIQALLSHSPKRLLSLKLEGMKSLAECSMMESSMRREKARIEALHPKDADEILKSVQK